jgi:hypothetical protein
MHPLYDYHGRGGRQIFRTNKDGTKRLAWGHTLCCHYLAYNGLLYGCNMYGKYNGDDDDDEIKDTRKPNSLICQDKFVKMYGKVPITQFRYYLPKRRKDSFRAAVEERQELKCYICGKLDHKNGSMRIPFQCNAGDENEFDWKEWYGVKEGIVHPSLEVNCPCSVALHVGCARWGGMNQRKVTRINYHVYVMSI